MPQLAFGILFHCHIRHEIMSKFLILPEQNFIQGILSNFEENVKKISSARIPKKRMKYKSTGRKCLERHKRRWIKLLKTCNRTINPEMGSMSIILLAFPIN
jgi:hypothetical protein